MSEARIYRGCSTLPIFHTWDLQTNPTEAARYRAAFFLDFQLVMSEYRIYRRCSTLPIFKCRYNLQV